MEQLPGLNSINSGAKKRKSTTSKKPSKRKVKKAKNNRSKVIATAEYTSVPCSLSTLDSLAEGAMVQEDILDASYILKLKLRDFHEMPQHTNSMWGAQRTITM